jgi:uncharacterized protein
MSHTPHELADEFPNAAEKIHLLKAHDPHFATLVEDYHAVNRQVHRAETRVEPMTEAAESALRHRRAHLKDNIARLLATFTG